MTSKLPPGVEPEVIYADMDPENPDCFSCESMCPQCEKNGTTRLMLCKLNMHKETIISSFLCPHCDYSNNDVQSGAEIEARGLKFELKAKTRGDLNRQLIKTQAASLSIPEIELEIPSMTQEGLTTTVEGILGRVIEQLSSEQPVRKHMAPEDYEQIEKFLGSVRELASGTTKEGTGELVHPFTLKLDDASGLSNIEPLPEYRTITEDPNVYVTTFERSKEQLEAMGFFKEQTAMADIPTGLRPDTMTTNEDLIGAGEFMDAECSSCGYDAAKQRFCEIDIPGFRRCLIMAFVCERCGFKDSEVKPSGDLGDHGKKWTLVVKQPEELNRDILKSDFAKITLRDLRDLPDDVKIPDVDLEAGTLGALFSTVEGLCNKASETLDSTMPFYGDSTQEGNSRAKVWARTVSGLKDYGSGMKNQDGSLMFPFTMVVEDLADHSFIGERQAVFFGEHGRADLRTGHDDDQLHVEEFQRTAEQNEELGITQLLEAQDKAQQ